MLFVRLTCGPCVQVSDGCVMRKWQHGGRWWSIWTARSCSSACLLNPRRSDRRRIQVRSLTDCRYYRVVVPQSLVCHLLSYLGWIEIINVICWFSMVQITDLEFSLVLWHCWLCKRKGLWPVKKVCFCMSLIWSSASENEAVKPKLKLVWHGSSCDFLFVFFTYEFALPLVLWHCWLGIRKSIWPVKIELWGASMVICLQWGVDNLHMVQLMPLPPHHLLLY